ncbi:MAG: elongation factor G [Acidimicrobiia bacterium]
MEPEGIRNIALVGHGGSGKTSLAEALLYSAGVTTRLGRVEEGSTTMDFEPEEVDRGLSLSLAISSLERKGIKINLIDTPGYADFLGEARSALRAADLALFVVNAVAGVEVQTELLWEAAVEEGVSRAVFVNMLDRERASFPRVLAELRERFGKEIAPIHVPIGAEHEFKGLVRAITSKAFVYAPEDPAGQAAEIPDDIAPELEEVRTAVVESAVETDDELLERYFDGDEPTPDELVAAIHSGMINGEIVPVLCGSATHLIGIDILADFLVEFAPTPLERKPPPLLAGELTQVDPGGPAAVYVFKTVADPYVGQISLFRVFTGAIPQDAEVENAGRGTRGRMHNLFFMQGKEHQDATNVTTGDIAAVAKLEGAFSGDTLRTVGSGLQFEPVPFPRPFMSVAVTPKSSADEDKLSLALRRATEDDPTLALERRKETRETVLSGMGETHLDVTLARVARKFGAEAVTSVPLVPYRETITTSAEAEGKHKKQTGGRGQFGVAWVRFEPLTRGTGYEFVDQIKGGAIPRGFIPAVDKGVKEAMERGPVAGFPVVDVRATVYDGKYHSVDSDETSFRMAGILAFRGASPSLGAVLLEPIVKLEIKIPEDATGDVMGDLSAKRGAVLGMDTDGKARVVTAEAPLAEVQRYAVDLRSMTGGRGTFEMVFDRYEPVPHQESTRIITAARAAQE